MSNIATFTSVAQAELNAKVLKEQQKIEERARKAQEKLEADEKKKKEKLEEGERKKQEKLQAEKDKKDAEKRKTIAQAQSQVMGKTVSRPSHYDNLTIEEEELYDGRVICYLYYNWDRLVKEGKIGKAFDPKTKDYLPDEVYRSQFEKFVKELDVEHFPIVRRQVVYTQASYKYGRYVCRDLLGLQNISRPFRQTMSHRFYRDCDVVNCHLILYRKMCVDLNLPTKYLDIYISRREEMFKLLEAKNPGYTREVLKQMFLSRLNGGSGKPVKLNKERLRKGLPELPDFKECEETYEYSQEVKANHIKIVEHLDKVEPKYRVSVEKGDKEWNVEGSIVNHWLVDMENRIEFYLCDYLKYQHTIDNTHYPLKPEVHCFDGCMINITNPQDKEYLTDDLLLKAQQYIKLKTGFDITLKFKDFEEIIPISETDLNCYSINDPIFKYFNWRQIDEEDGTDKTVADLCSNYFKDDYIVSDMKEFTAHSFQLDTKLWKTVYSEDIINSIADVLKDGVNKAILNWINKFQNAEDEDEAEMYKKKIADWIVRKSDRSGWGNVSKCKNVLTCLKPTFRSDNFIDKMNVEHRCELPIKNGYVIDLSTGETRERKQTDLYDYECPVDYIPWDAIPQEQKDIVMEYMNVMFQGNEDVINFMRVLSGMLMTKETTDRSMFFVGGTGRNGKTFYFEKLLGAILGKSFKSADPKAFVGKKSNFVNNLKSISKASLALLSEGEDGESLNTSTLKRITGGDTINGEMKGADVVDITMLCKIVFLFNMSQAPQCDVKDAPLWDRLVCLWFPHQFNIDKKIENEAKCEVYLSNLDAFFSYFVSGAIDWYKNKDLLTKANHPKEIIEATKAFKLSNDFVSQFIDDSCEVGEGLKEDKYNLFEAFNSWAHKKKIWNERNKAWGRNTFYDHILSIGYSEVREGESSVRMFGGIKLIPKNYEDYETSNNNDTIIC